MDTVTSFDEEYRFLSTDDPCEVIVDGHKFANAKSAVVWELLGRPEGKLIEYMIPKEADEFYFNTKGIPTNQDSKYQKVLDKVTEVKFTNKFLRNKLSKLSGCLVDNPDDKETSESLNRVIRTLS